jgi:hypothetical protein
MKKNIIKEFFWLAACLIAAFLVAELVTANNAADINMHDTYIAGSGHALSSTYFVFGYFIIIGFCLYLIRAVYSKFSIMETDIILLVFAGLASCFLYDTIFIIHLPVIDDTALAPVKGLFYGGSYSNSYIWGIRIIKIFLVFVLAFTGYMMGRHKALSSKTI